MTRFSFILPLLLIMLPCLLAAQGHRSSRQRGYQNKAASSAWTGDSYSYNFDGVDEYVSISDEDALTCATAMTACLWIYPEASNANDAMLAKGTSAFSEEWELETRTCTGGVECEVMLRFSGVPKVYSSTKPLTQDAWHFVCARYDGSGATNLDKAKVYVDNVDVADLSADTVPSSLTNGSGPFTVAQWNGATRYNNIIVSEVYMWCSALSTANLTALYNSGTPVDPTSVVADPVVYLRMGDNAGDSATVVVNEGSASNATATNMEAGDITTTVP